MTRTKVIISILLVLLTLGGIAFAFTKKVQNKEIRTEVLGEVTLAPTETILPTTIITGTPEMTPLPTVTATTEVTPEVTSQPIRNPPTPTPTTEPTIPFTIIAPIDPKIDAANAGTVTALEFNNLNEKTLYQINLSEYTATTLVIAWPNTTSLLWSTSTRPTNSSLTEVPTDDDSQGIESQYYSGLLDVPKSKVLYLLPQASIPKLTISLINPSTDSTNFKVLSTTGIYNSNSGASYTSLPIVSRDEWGADPASWDSHSSANIDDPVRFVWNPVYYKAARIIIHHTVTSFNASNPKSSVRAIYLYHAYVRDNTGWGDIGYNYLIDPNGTIYEGKAGGDESQGYHAFGSANRISIGISLIGDFTNSGPTTAAKNALIKLIAEKGAFYGFALKYSDGGLAKWKDPSYTVFGHRSSYRWYSGSSSWGVNSTACPGNAFFPQLPALVQTANTYRMNNYAQLKQLTTDVEKSISMPHEIGTILVKYKVPNSTPESTMQTYIPAFSGISSYTISGNTITYKVESTIITHPNGDTEYSIPPSNWTGYFNEYATFTTPPGKSPFMLNGPEDRAKTLLKIFRLDPRVDVADLKHYLAVQ